MPLIEITVPVNTNDTLCHQAEEAIKDALGKMGVKKTDVTVWFSIVYGRPNRLLLRYESRSPVENPNERARIIGKIAAEVFGKQVESVVQKLDRETTGIHITPERQPEEDEVRPWRIA
ncbi:MAG: hypothetical protein A3I39_01475 [Candidatus Yanofskybacteria bacterium RIFCSPLOWO2_02_FULL_47_9b]|uniref:4-oxalocrotonate tautomerase domain-containing protein n=1 Tax=Candidatus Yanofskybacteria bacterium RIFCSPLOWO2_02_FULL_47_9b TaxID=1802708 RepID=A0A1F8H8I7_9BACT|nr:MAG: hypothetical protein A3I39_01475 [Candidatus Yanofskybacteria bacterium RIFCSPLOWO2_02_FULL_47_9b]